MTTANKRIRALVIAHDARATGGVNNFLRVMRVCYRARIEATRISNGPRSKEQGRFSKLKRMALDYVNFVGLLRRRQFDVLHANPSLDLSSTPRELVFVWLAWIFQRRMRRIVFYRGWRHDSFNRIHHSRILRMLFLATHRHIDRTLVLSQEFADALIGIGVDPKRIFVTTTMFESSLFDIAPIKANQPRTTILFLARFLPAKGGAELIAAFARVARQFPEWRLVMGGWGPDAARLMAAANASGVVDRIDFPGYVRGEGKARLLQEAGIFALPTTHSEGMPNAILEAMAAGQIVITTAVGGIKDVVKDGVNGAIIPDAGTDAIERALRHYMEHPEEIYATAERNREVAWGNYESLIVADRMADHYARVMS